MEFHGNRAKQPFISIVQVWRAFNTSRAQAETRRILLQVLLYKISNVDN